MTTPVVANSIRKFFVIAALAGLALGALPYAAPPAEAKKKICLQKYQACQGRCFKRNDDPFPCISRTCDRQYDNCVADRGTPAEGAFAWIWQAPHDRQSAQNSPSHEPASARE